MSAQQPRLSRSIAPAIVLSAMAALSGAQDASQPTTALFGERVDVEVVNVDVVVTDREGRRVTDLGRDDFELTIDGKPVAIEYFAAPGARLPVAPPPALAAEGAAPLEIEPRAVSVQPSSLLVVYVDQSALEVRASNRIVEEIHEFVLPRLDGGTAVLMAAFVDQLRVLAPMTTDRATVQGAFEELQKIRGRGSLIQSERHALEADIRSVMIAAPADPIRRQQFLQAQRIRLQNDIQAFGERALDRQRRSVGALREWVNALAAIEGRKSVLLATNGFTSEPGTFLQGLTDVQLKGSSAFSVLHETFGTNEALATEGQRLLDEFEEMLRSAENARVAFYTVSPRTPPVVQGSVEFGGMGIESNKPPPRDLALVESSSSVVRLGVATGGGSLYLDDDLSRKLTRVVDDEAAVYSLGFTTSEAAGGKEHPIEVTVRRADLRVQHRESYRRRTLEERVEQALAAAVSLRAGTNPLGIRVELGAATPPAKRGQGSIVPLVVHIPLRSLALVPTDGRLRGNLSARVAILDAKGEQRFGPPTPIAVNLAATDEAKVESHSWSFRADMRLAPGQNRIAVVITDEVAGVLSAAAATIDVPKKGG